MAQNLIDPETRLFLKEQNQLEVFVDKQPQGKRKIQWMEGRLFFGIEHYETLPVY